MKHRTDRPHSSWEVTKTVRTEVDCPERQERALSLEMGRRDSLWDLKLCTGHVGAGSSQFGSTNTWRVRPILHKQTGKTFTALAIKRRIVNTQRPPSEEVVLGVLFCFSMITCSIVFKVFFFTGFLSSELHPKVTWKTKQASAPPCPRDLETQGLVSKVILQISDWAELETGLIVHLYSSHCLPPDSCWP